MSLLDRKILGTPLVAVDVETTGLHPGEDRIVEIAIVKVPEHHHEQPEVLFDSLVDPRRPIGATEIHGITDEELMDAPTFEQLAGPILRALHGAVMVSHNAYFDQRFLAHEFRRLGYSFEPPLLCTMLLAEHAKLGSRYRLVEACARHGIPYEESHLARDDATATARLMAYYGRTLHAAGLERFRDVARMSASKFIETWKPHPIEGPPHSFSVGGAQKPRTVRVAPWSGPRVGDYTAAALEVISDYVITNDEVAHLAALRDSLALSPEQIRSCHATIFTWALTGVAADAWVDDTECVHLQRVRESLSALGWAPGDPVSLR